MTRQYADKQSLRKRVAQAGWNSNNLDVDEIAIAGARVAIAELLHQFRRARKRTTLTAPALVDRVAQRLLKELADEP